MSNDQGNTPEGFEYNEPNGYPDPNEGYGSYSPYYQRAAYPYSQSQPYYGTGGYGTPSYYGGMPYTGGTPQYSPTGMPGGYPPTGAGYPTTPSGGPPAAGGMTPTTPSAPSPGQTGVEVPGLLPSEQSYIENILRLNLGKIATIYMTFENNTEWNAKVFQGKVQAAGRDHIIISDPDTGKRFLLPMIYLDYITFEGPINYSYTFE